MYVCVGLCVQHAFVICGELLGVQKCYRCQKEKVAEFSSYPMNFGCLRTSKCDGRENTTDSKLTKDSDRDIFTFSLA